MRSWTAEVTAFGVVVRIEQVLTQLPLGHIQLIVRERERVFSGIERKK
jgi:hypothetical protein